MNTPRTLPDAMKAYRIGDPNGTYPIWSPGGAQLVSGRWHEAGIGAGVIYASKHYSTAMLEKLVHFSGSLPPNQHFLDIHVPAGTSYEVVNPDTLPGWADPGGDVARRFGRSWLTQARSAILIVPSVVARMEQNVLFNTGHPDFGAVTPGLETPIWWDARLFD